VIPPRRAAERFLRLHPAFPLLAGLLAGVVPLAVADGRGLAVSAALCLAILAGAAMARGGSPWRPDLAKFAIAAALGMMLAWGGLHPGEGHLHRQLPTGPCGVEMEVVAVDPAAVRGVPAWLPNPALPKARLLRYRSTPHELWREAHGAVALRLPPESPRLGFGDILRVRGTCAMADPALFPGDFDFRRHLLSQGIWRVVQVRECAIRGTTPDWWLRLGRAGLALRDRLLVRLTAPCRDDDSRRVLAALLFGCRQGLDARERQAFQASGTIHVFAISGLHVGMVGLALLMALRWVPFRPRHLLVPVLLGAYVLSTGFQPAAVRALLMFGLWLVQRARLRPSSPLNAVFLAAVVIMACQPLACLGAGFQFSFTVTGFLVLAWQSGRAWPEMAVGSGRWIPARLLRPSTLAASGLRRRIAGSVYVCLVAWLASLGINLVQNGGFVPSAPLTNFALLPLLSGLFMAVSVQALLLPVAFLADLMGMGVEVLLGLCRMIGGYDAGLARAWLPPHPAVLLLYYLALTVLVTAHRRLRSLAAAAVLGGILVAWHLRDAGRPPAVLVMHGGDSQTPTVVLCPGAGEAAVVVNAPSHGAARLRNLLLAEGIREVDTLLLPSPRREHALGAAPLVGAGIVRRLMLPATWRAGISSREAVAVAAAEGTEVVLLPVSRAGPLRMRRAETGLDLRLRDGTDWRLAWRTAEATAEVACRDLQPGLRRLELRLPGQPPRRLDLPNRNRAEVIRIPLGQTGLIFPRNPL
jgi:ComEC/Rec2-related protein